MSANAGKIAQAWTGSLLFLSLILLMYIWSAPEQNQPVHLMWSGSQPGCCCALNFNGSLFMLSLFILSCSHVGCLTRVTSLTLYCCFTLLCSFFQALSVCTVSNSLTPSCAPSLSFYFVQCLVGTLALLRIGTFSSSVLHIFFFFFFSCALVCVFSLALCLPCFFALYCTLAHFLALPHYCSCSFALSCAV